MSHFLTSISPVLTDNASVQDMGLMGPLNQIPSVKTTATAVREDITRFNEYKNEPNLGYGPQHPNAQSDGDDHGRGETGANSGVGTSIDKERKNALIYGAGLGLSNKFKPGNGYYNYNYSEQYW